LETHAKCREQREERMGRYVRSVAAAVAVFLFTAPMALAQSQQWPQRAVKFVVPLGPGAGVDILGRLIADRLGQKWGQSVVVDNKPGGDGVVGVTTFTNARDTHTLLLSPTSAFIHHPWAVDKMPYDPRDLVPIARTTNTIVAIVVPTASSINSLSELFKTIEANPGKLNQANITGFFDMVFHAFLKSHNLVVEPVPYRNPVQAANDLSEGRIQLLMSAIAISRPYVQAGKAKFIAVTAPVRAPTAPDVPTTAEAGYPDLTIEGLVGLFGPRDLSPPIRERIAADVKTALADPLVTTRLVETGQIVNFGGPKDFEASMDKQRNQAAGAAKVLGLKAAEM
jgi:tripartite-type tricarboxylate transporter receptor subunit TctC